VTPKGQTTDPNTLRAQYLAHSWICYVATITNYNLVCCDAVQSAILSTAWLLADFYRAMHFIAKRGIAIACRPSVRLSVCLSVFDVGGL